MIYQNCETGKYGLIAYDLNSGNNSFRIKKNHSRSSPIYHNQRVFHQTLSGKVICFNYYTGEEIWQLSLSNPVYNSLALKDNIIYSASTKGEIKAIENTSGVIIWESSLNNSVLADPIIFEETPEEEQGEM